MRVYSLMVDGPQAADAPSDARRAIMLKNLLVHIPSERQISPIVDGAVSLAMTRAAHLDAVSIGFETSTTGFSHGWRRRDRGRD